MRILIFEIHVSFSLFVQSTFNIYKYYLVIRVV